MRTVGNRTDLQTLGLQQSVWDTTRALVELTPEQQEVETARLANLARYHRRAARAKAERVNKHNLLITHRTEADRDKSGKLTGRSAPNGSNP